MSTSREHRPAKRSATRQAGRRFRLNVRTNSDTEIFVIDGLLGALHRSVGNFSGVLAAGLYKVRVVRGGGNREQLVDLDRRRDLVLYCETFPAIAPIGPMLGNLVPQVEELARAAVRLQGKWPAGGILMLAHGQRRARTTQERLLHGMVLRRWNDSAPELVPDTDRPHSVIGEEDWEAQWWPATPGCYVLSYNDGTHQAEQALLVAKSTERGAKWQTRVFIREAGEGNSRRTNVSIQMARHDSPVVYYDHYETIETARNALENDRPIVSQWLINNLLHGKFDNPLMGLVGLHLFLSALEDVRAGKLSTLDPGTIARAERDIGVVLSNLGKLLGGQPPDLIALQVRAGQLRDAQVAKVTEPPMFWKSWDILRRNTDEGESVIIDRDLWNRISLCAPAGPYFAWQQRADVTTIPERYAELAARVKAETIEDNVRFVDRGNANLFRTTPARIGPRLLSVKEVAQALGVPLSVLADNRPKATRLFTFKSTSAPERSSRASSGEKSGSIPSAGLRQGEPTAIHHPPDSGSAKANAKTSGKRRALSLHIGLNGVSGAAYGGWDGPLAACEFDANDMAAIATKQGMKPTVLLTKKATRTAVLAAMRNAAKTLAAGDFFFLTYSGHGGQVPDVNGDEDDKKDETWCLYDGQLIDDELYFELGKFKSGVRILVLSDSCHSGTVTREATLPPVTIPTQRPKNMPDAVAMRTYSEHQAFYDKIQMDVAKRAGKPVVDPENALWQVAASGRLSAIASTFDASLILISGCQDNQTSMDGEYNGVFTEQLLAVWNHGAFKSNYAKFHATIRSRMPATQSPNLFTLGATGAFLAQKPFSI